MIKETPQTDGQLLKLVSSLAKTEVVSLEDLNTLKAEVISEIQKFSQEDLYTPQQMFCICLLIHISKKQEDLQTFLDMLSM